MKILMAGGGSGGPVVPLLAVAEKLKGLNPQAEFLFVGTNHGPERQLVTDAGYKFAAIPAAKFRRYFSLKNISDIFVFVWSLVLARKIVSRFMPDVMFSVGGYASVPIAKAAKSKGIKIIIHQQDVQPGLANRMIAPYAKVITTSFEETANNFVSRKYEDKKFYWVGNPVRAEFSNNDLPHKDFFKLHDKLPILLILGGGTGAIQINSVVEECLPELVKSHQVVHVSGAGKMIKFQHPDYHQYEFLGREFPTILKMAHVVISRAGLSTIGELSSLGKIAIIVPMPDSHQEANAQVLKKRGAAIVLNKEEFNAETLVRVVNSAKFNDQRQQSLIRNMQELMPHDAAYKIAEIILSTHGK